MEEQQTYQVAIIGGGLAGLTLAIQLRKGGISVIVFEKESYPFHKVCGEYISMESWDFIESLGIPLSSMNLPRITQLNVSAPNGSMLSHRLELGGFGISRFTLDNQLFERAKQLGVVVKEQCKVQDVIHHSIQTNQGYFSASVVIGSWGKRSRMDAVLLRDFQQPGNRTLNNYVGVKYHVQANLPDNLIELHNFKNGYCGISKIEDNKYCMCYLVSGEELKKAGGNIQQLEETVLMRNPYLHKYFKSFPSLYERPLTISQISFERKRIIENNMLMVGDAAGLITPLCGNGMTMAMHASKIAAVQLIRYFNQEQSYLNTQRNYKTAWEKEFQQRLRIGRLLQGVFGGNATTNSAILFFRLFSGLLSYLVGKTHGKKI
ncbi:MAG: NAD(P)/FAD-dependent oxidoreductase [Bacteroidota bacterium]